MPMPRLNMLSAVLLASVVGLPLSATAANAPTEVLSAFGLDSGTLVEVEIVEPATRRDPTLVRVAMPGHGEIELRLAKRSVRSPHYRFLLSLPDGGFEELPHPPVSTYRGTIAGDPGSRAALSILPEGISGIVVRGDGTRFAIEAISKRVRGFGRGGHVVYEMDEISPVDAWCGVTDDEGGIDPDPHGPMGMSSGVLQHAELAIDCDWSFVERVGGTNEDVGQRVDLVVNTMNLQYNSEVDLDHDIVAVVVRTEASDPYEGSGLCVEDGLEDQVAEIWSVSSIPHDIAHLFTGRVDGGTVGCNSVGQVCQDDPYGASAVDFNGNLATSTDLVAHELGHGWGASHCPCSDPPYTMNAFLTSANTFNPDITRPVIATYAADNGDCLDAFQPASCGDVDAGNCFASNGTPHCNDESCCIVVCAIDSFCCTNEWDAFCVDLAFETCTDCGDPDAGSPFQDNGTPGCDDLDCCVEVCAVDGFCCRVNWDDLCAQSAIELCTDCGDEAAGSAYTAAGAPGCDDLSCCQEVCPVDPFCCDVAWDTACVENAVELCVGCGASDSGTTYEANDTPGCANADCCLAVCQSDPFCCETVWDELCAALALIECGNCGTPAAGSAYTANGSPGCANLACCEEVCVVDPVCCDSTWDVSCVTTAFENCTNCGDAAAGSPFEANGTPGCDDAECCFGVCSVDDTCCDVEWDEACATLAFEICGTCGGADVGSCNESNDTPGCADAACCSAVCLDDPYCCEVIWDTVCAGAANTICGSPCIGDLNGDGGVDGGDLASLLGGWGGPGAGDLNGDGEIGGADLAEMLGNWGTCP